MKLFYIFLLMLLPCVLQAQIVTIPDANFKNALINTNCVDTNGDGIGDSDADLNDDGEIQVTEAESIFWLNVAGENISSLEGIQSFINLEELIVFDNDLTSLDITQNSNIKRVSCSLNNINNIDISQNTNLEDFTCGGNQLNALDVSQNLNLKKLLCDDNAISSLDISQNINLEALGCSNNQLISLDLRQNLMLESLICSYNELTSLFIDNGNNHNMFTMISLENPDLICIQIDDKTATYPECVGFPLEGWCIDPWTSFSEKCIFGLTDLDAINIKLYPNPIKNFLILESQEPILSITVYDLLGRAVLSQKGNTTAIDTSTFPSGIYFLKINTEEGYLTKKVIKR